MKIKLIADSTCDLPKELIEKHNIEIVPLHILLGEESYDDGININPDMIYKWSDDNNTTPSTSAPSFLEVTNVYNKFIADYDQIICFTIAKAMSSTFNVFRLAAEELEIEDKVFIVNSKNLSSGIGLLVLKAAELIEQGLSGEEIYETIKSLLPKVRSSFIVDTLVYLHRGGRCSSIAALAGSALKLHPMIVVEDGRMHATKKYRGPIDKVFGQYVNDLSEQLENADKSRCFVTHSGGVTQETIDAIVDDLKVYNFNEILFSTTGGVISSHCGPKTLGVLFIEQ